MMKDFDELFKGWVTGTLSEPEADAFLAQLGEQDDALHLRIDELLLQGKTTGLGNTEQKERLFQRLTEKIALNKQQTGRRIQLPIVKWAAAAMLILLAGAGYWYYYSNNKAQVKGPVVTLPGNTILPPGTNKATLVLSNGEKILLDSSNKGQLAQQPGALIFKSDSGLITYKAAGQQDAIVQLVTYNTLSTPRGGQYKLRLADGTVVWLNAASSITYPTAFSNTDRNVAITGEAYFEVAKDPSKPFHVTVNDMQVTVLGTHFNISAYEDEPSINTTLSEGLVKVNKAGIQQFLQPGQQARLDKSGMFRMVPNVDTSEVVAWKNGYFSFSHADLPVMMRQFARWYNVTVTYKGDIPDMKFTGDIPRSADTEQVLKILEASKIHFTVEGNTITVSP